MAQVPIPPPFREAVRFWAKLGWIGFGGPTGQFSILHEELVVRRGWISESDFLQGLNYCLMLPGPEAQQFATYLGWRLHGTRGALAAGVLFFIPAMLILWALSVVYVLAGTTPVMTAALYGLGPAVLAIILRALLHLARRTLKTPIDLLFAAGAAVLMIVFQGNYPLIVLLTAIVGVVMHRSRPTPEADTLRPPPIQVRQLLRTALTCVLVWWTPLLAAWLALGRTNIIVAEGLFFAKATLVTFGGAYVVLPYVTAHAVGQHHWLSAGDMLHGVSLASAIPGPLVIVTQFVGFMGAWHQPGTMKPLMAATGGALLTTWVTFAPSFLYILVGGPIVRWVVRIPFLQGALRAISAGVVGVMIDFALWFGGKVLFPAQRFGPPDWFALAASAAALFVLVRFRVSVPLLLAGGTLLGLLEHAVLGRF